MSLQLGRKFLLSWTAMVLGVGSNVLLYRLQLHALGPALLGIWIAVSTVCFYLTLLELGLSAAVNRHVATSSAHRDCAAESQAIITSLVMFTALGLFVFLIGSALSSVIPSLLHIPAPHRDRVRAVSLILAADTATIFFFNSFRSLVMGRGHSEAIAIITILRHLIYSVLTVLVVRFGHSLPRLAWAILIADGSAGVILALLALRIWSPRRWVRPSASLAQQFLRCSAAVVLAYTGQHLLRNAALPLLQRTLGPEAVAQYAAAARLSTLFFMIMTQVGTVTTPLLAKVFAQGEKDLQQTVLKLARLGLAAGLAPLVVLLALGDFILGAWLGPSMIPSAALLRVLGVGMFAQLFSIGTDVSNYALGGLWSYAFVKLSFALVAIGFLWLGIRWGYAPGAAWGSTLAIGLCDGIFIPFVTCRALHIRIGDYYRSLLRRLAPLVAALMAAAVALRFIKPMSLSSVLVVCVIGTGIGWIFTFFYYLEIEERSWLRGRATTRGRSI